MNDDARQIADYLIEQHGIDGAFLVVREGIEVAHADRNNYRLSVWREVRRTLKDKRDDAHNQEALAV